MFECKDFFLIIKKKKLKRRKKNITTKIHSSDSGGGGGGGVVMAVDTKATIELLECDFQQRRKMFNLINKCDKEE